MKSVAVIGGGAAGMMAVASILEHGYNGYVHLFEKNAQLGVKVRISGGGRCNVTTGFQDIREILKKYPRGKKFLRYALHEFSPQDVCAWFEQHGVPLIMEEDMRIFPKSHDGTDIVRAFEKYFAKHDVHIHFRCPLEKIEKGEDGFVIYSKDQTWNCNDLILTTGGEAFRRTGSTGDGYAFAEQLGHHVTSLAPSLHSFHLAPGPLLALAGVSIPRISLSFENGEILCEGPMVCTHKGISGPVVFATSSEMAFEHMPFTLHCNFVPFLSATELEKYIQKELLHKKQQMKNMHFPYIPKSLFHAIFSEKTYSTKTGFEISKKDIQDMLQTLRAYPVIVVGRGKGEEFVTAGGIDLGEIDEKTCGSKITPHLHCAGEILDIDGYTGGFNLQNAWSTGYIAGRAVATANTQM